jgi:hypothetical protein
MIYSYLDDASSPRQMYLHLPSGFWKTGHFQYRLVDSEAQPPQETRRYERM